MIGVQNHNGHDKPFLGCLGHVVNLFDLSAGITGNRMPTDKSHREGSPLSRSRSDVSGMSLVKDQIQDKVTISELQRNSSNRTAHGTPVKMLIAEEMSKEVESKQKQPNVVAKLMGLEARPLQQSETQKCHSRGSSRSQSCVSFGSWQEEHELHQHQEQNDHKDVYEIRHSDNRYVRNKSPQKESFNRDIIDKKMALVRQNFIELKRLSTDEKLRQSKQFQDALEVLSSNKDSFLQFLQEPNSMFSQHLSDLQSVSPPYEIKRITILKPAKMVDGYSVTGSPKKNEKKINKNSHFCQINRLHKNSSGFSPQTSCKPENSQGHTTRIVVLKPAPGKPHEIKDAASPLSSKPKASRVEDPYVVVGNDDAQESSEVAKESNRQMAENLSQHRRDEILHPSVLSNGFTGDESSSNKSEIEYAVENLSDPEAISPTSRHSWSYINRFDSPYMLSSFSRASNSPESSVCREAKKRLSERWAMMASDGIQEQKHVRSSSTLGEMLALSDMKKTVITKEDCLTNKQHFRGSTSCFTSELNDEDKCNTPARNILRSKSAPVSSMVYSGGVLNPEVSDPKMEKTDIPKDLTKTRSMKSFLKGRVSSLFFSRNNKSSKQKVNSSREEFESIELARHCLESDVDIGVEAGEIPDLLGSGNKSSPLQSLDEESIEDRVYTKAAFSATKLYPFRGPIDKQGQPNPVSVLEPPFQEDDHREPEFTDKFSLLRNGFDLPVCPVKSNLIDKSPLVGSINARTLSWNDSCTENLSPYHSKSYAVQVSAEEERQEMFFLVQTLLAAAELGNESLCDTFLARWHSLESPLDPLLRDIYAGLSVKETLHEAKRIPRRSMQKLVFDCVNAALVELAMYGSDPWKSGTCWLHDQGSIVDYVWTQMEWFSGEVSCVKGEGMEHNSLAVERLVRKEVVGKGGADHTRLEIDNFCKEIEVNLLEELVQETVEEFYR